jgi:hypothetical protein
MSKKIYESKVAEEASKRFRMLCEYTFNITEDDGEEAADASEQDMPSDNGMEGMQQADMQGGNMPNMNGNEPDMGGEDNMQMQSQEQPQQGQGVTGFNPSEDNSMDPDESFDTQEMSEDDEVIDVDDLTQSQEETEEKVDDIQVSMEKGFDKLLNIVKKLDKMIDVSTSNMEQIKMEIEKRNPTPLEKLNMRAANDSYPFNVSPNDYWKQKEATSNYRIGGEDEPDAKQYTITQGDIDDITDFQRIAKELEDDNFNQNLMNIFGLR